MIIPVPPVPPDISRGLCFLKFIERLKDKLRKAEGKTVTAAVDVQKNGIEYDIISWPE